MGRVLVAAGLAAALLSAPGWGGSGPEYSLVDLGSLGAGATTPEAVNSQGQVVGSAAGRDGKSRRAFLWDDGVMRELPTLAGGDTTARDLNEVGIVVGSAMTPTGRRSAAYWDEAGIHELDGLGGPGAEAAAINTAGVVVGSALDASGRRHAVVWEHGRVRSLPEPRGSEQSAATDINARGQVAGWFIARHGSRPVRWSGGLVHVLPLLPGDLQGQALSINDHGEVLGISSSRKRGLQGVLWTGRRARSLGRPRVEGEPQSVFPGRLNNRGEVVGTLFGGDAGARAFYWSRGRFLDLQALLGPRTGWSLGAARGLSDGGQIAGLGSDPGGAEAGFLLTPAVE